MNGDFGVSFYTEVEDETELAADEYAQNTLIPSEKCSESFRQEKPIRPVFVSLQSALIEILESFLGRLKRDEYVPYAETELSHELRHKYKVKMNK